MRKLFPLFSLLSLTLLAARTEAAEPQMPVSEIRRGMEGTCQTVFQGKTIEPFGFRVLSLMNGMLGPRQDVILVRLTGEKAEFTGVVAGMSGSPCYIDGKLVGALAYRFGNFTREPIGGITPIANMLDMLKLPSQTARKQAGLYRPVPFHRTLQNASQLPGGLRPIATPLSFGGFRADVLSQYVPALEKLGFQPVLGGQSSPGGLIANPEMPQKLEPGSAIAGQLVRGDLSIEGTGTVSWVGGDKVLAFGHPFFNEGYVQIPMATAWIHHILASEAGSYKMSQSGVTVGSITQDRLTAIYGEVGQFSPMIPLAIKIHDNATVDPTALNMEVFHSPTMTPLLMAMSVHNVLSSRLNFNYGGTLLLKARLRTDGRELTFSNRYAVAENTEVITKAVQDLLNPLAALWNNPFQKPAIAGLQLEVSLLPEQAQSVIRRAWSDDDFAAPGQTITVHVELNTLRGQREIRDLSFKIPMDTPPGPVSLLLASGRGIDQIEDSVRTGYPDYASLLADLFSQRQSSDLHLLLLSDEGGLAQHSTLMPRLPASVQELLYTPASFSHTIPIRSPGSEQRVPLATELSGSALVSLMITPHARAIN